MDSLQGTPSRMSLFSFSTATPAVGATANFPNLTPVSTPAQGTAFKNRYAAWTADGFTNWDRGLGAAAAANSRRQQLRRRGRHHRRQPDGLQPAGPGARARNRFRETENGIFSANALKAGSRRTGATRVLAFGVGDGATGAANGLNLRAISGPTPTTAQRRRRRLLPDGRLRRRRHGAAQPRARQLPGHADRHQADRPEHDAPAGSIDGSRRRRRGLAVHGRRQHGRRHDADRRPDDDRGRHRHGELPPDLPGRHDERFVTVTETQQAGLHAAPGRRAERRLHEPQHRRRRHPTANQRTLGFTVDVPSTAGSELHRLQPGARTRRPTSR